MKTVEQAKAQHKNEKSNSTGIGRRLAKKERKNKNEKFRKRHELRRISYKWHWRCFERRTGGQSESAPNEKVW
jgi:hypothetical protein